MNASIALTVADVSVSQDEHGRFSLNDLHRAAGGKRAHQPSNWLRTDQTKRLISELAKGAEEHLSDAPNPQIRGFDESNVEPISLRSGNAGGTFVVRELVYAYAMWISAAFHLKVIRAYDALMTIGVRGTPRPSPTLSCIRVRMTLIKQLAQTERAFLARGYYRCLQLVDRELGIETEPANELAPALKQGELPGM